MKNFLCTIIFLALVACSTSKIDIKNKVPTSIGITPEAVGKQMGGEAALVLQSSAEHSTLRGYQADLPVLGPSDVTIEENSEVDKTLNSGIRGKLGIFERLDIAAIQSSSYYPVLIGAQYQFYGSPAFKREVGYKASIYTFAGYLKREYQSQDYVLFLPTEDDPDSELADLSGSSRMKAKMVGLSWGYRKNEHTLYYSTLHYAKTDTENEIIDDVQARHTNSSFSEMSTLALGVKNNPGSSKESAGFLFKAELGGSYFKAKGAEREEILHFLLEVGFYWGGSKNTVEDYDDEDEDDDRYDDEPEENKTSNSQSLEEQLETEHKNDKDLEKELED
ncbi:MAG: hypothetical protein H6621_01690 [Halobacteriovoraceae bacterium]|nr:hypothetical protein [Halobacteriovoraceae bacterium]MCB9093754.1 hypothetical protein [Halobacteriovoraceae bacterium]